MTEYVPDYGIPPGDIAKLDGYIIDVGKDLDTTIASFRHHAGRVDDTIAFAVLADNIHQLVDTGQLSTGEVCNLLALAVQRLSKAAARGGEDGTP